MTESTSVIRCVAGVFLVDGEGCVLLQHRDADAPTAPNQWGLLGGGIEADEEPEAAARREVQEESGLAMEGPLALWWHGLLPSTSVPGGFSEWYVYCAPTDARQEDVVVGEGQAIAFVAPAQALALDLSRSARDLVPRFLASAAYRRLRGIASPRPRLRELGIRIGRLSTGVFNAITDVPGVLVGQTTIVHDEPRVARTGVTVVLPREGTIWTDHAFAGFFSFNGCGEMTGLPWVEESGLLTSPIGITNTFSIGAVHEALIAYATEHGHGAMHLPVVAETYDGWLNDIGAFQVRQEHVYAALDGASAGPVAEGNVGGGTGMICHQFKGGTGTASRLRLDPERRAPVKRLGLGRLGHRTRRRCGPLART
ncbi:MAG TPA: P1 family peptidase [Ktedonobacterales bacterium]|nr:P1 family peptidase [Ktedonobacterales bacterium]